MANVPLIGTPNTPELLLRAITEKPTGIPMGIG
jgi:hypothetical protein